MKGFILSASFVLVMLASNCFAQIYGDVQVPEQVPSNSNAKIVIQTDARFVSIRVRRSLFDVIRIEELDNGLRNIVAGGASLKDLQEYINKADRSFVFTGPDGEYLVEITFFDPKLGIKEEARRVVFGSRPQPTPTPDPKPTPDDPDPKPTPTPGTLEADVKNVLKAVNDAAKREVVKIRQPDGNTIERNVMNAIGQQYGDIAREAKNLPGSWDAATMVDESRIRIAGVIPTSSLTKWLDFFRGLTKLQVSLDPNKTEDWINFFETVESVLSN